MDGLAVVIVKCRASGLEGRRFGAALSFLVECPGFVGQAVFNRAVSVVDGAYFRNVPAWVVADERLDSFFVGFRPLAGLPFIQEKFVSNQNILPSVHQVIKSQSSAADGWACAWAGAAVQMS